MGEASRVIHYVKPNETTRVPRRHIFLDTESTEDSIRGGHEQRWALAVACFRAVRKGKSTQEQWATYDDPLMLWRDVDAWCKAGKRTILWTHNLGYDVRISEAFTLLPELGWTLTAHNLGAKGAWLIWRRDGATLSMVDSASVFPTTLAQIGKTLGMGKRPLPDRGAGGIGLYSRCWQDVAILREAVTSYVDWLEREDLGNWQLTGAGQSWAAWRHRHMDHRVLIHDDAEALTAERRAMWTGRCEAYWHGELNRQVVHEWDFTLAYPRIARDTYLPSRLIGPMPDSFDWQRAMGSKTTALLAEVTVTTRLPVVPTMDDGHILWPVGTFNTTLWDVEISEAIKEGAHVTVHRGWLYRKAPILATWASWIMGELQSIEDSEGDWRYMVLKHWARALIGRYAMSYVAWDEWATAPTAQVRCHDVYDRDTGETNRVVQIGHTIWMAGGHREWQESAPMVTGYVQSVARVRYWRLYRAMPPDAALYGDTDSVLVTDRHLHAMDAIARAHPEWGLRLKRSWDGFAVWGPRQIRTGALVRIAGVPRRAARVDKRTFAGEVWETLAGSLAKGHSQQVVIRDRVWEIRGVDRRRDGPEIGWTTPRVLGGESNENPGNHRQAERVQRRDRGQHLAGRDSQPARV